MEHRRTASLGLAAATVAATFFASFAHAAAPAFAGNVCALVTPTAVRAAGIAAPCVQAKSGATYVASWGTSAADSDHFMSVQIGPVKSTTPEGLSKLLPRGPGKLLGPLLIAPGIKAYYSLSAYHGTAGGRGTMRFVDKSRLVQLTLVNATGNTLSGLEAVARATASNM
jgi:hypothetical protein